VPDSSNAETIDDAQSWSGDPADTIECLYQPIIDLNNRAAVGFEALARWPGRPDLNPDAVFGAARRHGTLDVLDHQAQLAAIRGAATAALPPDYTLFINVEADTSPGVSPASTIVDATRGEQAPRIIIELTEKALLTDPARVIEITDTARSLGVGIALDDVGANPDSLTMLEFVAPDVIKIDGALVRSRHLSSSHCATVAAIAAYIETSPDTTIIAEGIETPADLEQALSLGATHGQGWLLGRPAPLPEHFPNLAQGSTAFSADRSRLAANMPSEVLDGHPTLIGRKSMLTRLSKHLEDTATTLGEPVTLLAAFQHASNFTPTIAQRFSVLARSHPHAFIAALGVDMPSRPAPHVHGTTITDGDPLADEWTITVMAPHYCAALIAHDLGDPDTEVDRHYTYLLTHDRRVVTTAARSLMQRIRRPAPQQLGPVVD
jgi:EAL domain-containing protein (putative c-di-GMP-specific phosphodiesterase class I)